MEVIDFPGLSLTLIGDLVRSGGDHPSSAFNDTFPKSVRFDMVIEKIPSKTPAIVN